MFLKIYAIIVFVNILRAWFSGRTGPCQGSDSGSIPGARTNNRHEAVFVCVAPGIERRSATARVGVAGFSSKKKPVTDSHMFIQQGD